MRKIKNHKSIKNTAQKTISAIFATTIIGFSILSASAVDTTDSTKSTDATNPTVTADISVRYSGATVISENTDISNQSYASTQSSENAILFSGGKSTLNDANITKSGNTEEEADDLYGTNSAVLAYNGAELTLSGGYVSTADIGASGVFSYGTGVINILNSFINTSKPNSNGIEVAGMGTITAKNATVSTTGKNSSAIKANQSRGIISVDGGTYSTSGKSSPAVYSGGDVRISNATLTSTSSEGIVIEGENSVSLKNTNLNDTNTVVSKNTDTYKNIFIYRQEESDTLYGNANLRAEDCKITTNKGDTIFVTNSGAIIDLISNTIVNSNGYFLRVQKSNWGKEGSNGGSVNLNMESQNIKGDIFVDDISSLAMSLESNSKFEGAVNTDNTAEKISLSLSADSTVILTADTYLSALTNDDLQNSNIYLNGHKLFVNDTEVSANTQSYTSTDTTPTASAQPASNETKESSKPQNVQNTPQNSTDIFVIVVFAGVFVIVIVLIIAVLLKKSGYVLQKKKLEDKEYSTENNFDNPDESD